ncbi:MAG: hypothetical protein WD648_10080 [Planctomycetaceae bacterium]
MNVRRVLFLTGWLLIAAIGLAIGSSRGIVASDGADEKATSGPDTSSTLGSYLRGGAYFPDPAIEQKLRALKAPVRPKTKVRKPAVRPKADLGRSVRIDEPRTANMEQHPQAAPAPKAAAAAEPATKSAERFWHPAPSTETGKFENERHEQPFGSEGQNARGEGWRRGASASQKNEPAADAVMSETPAEADTKDDATEDVATEKAATTEVPAEDAGNENALTKEPKTEDAPSKDVGTDEAPMADAKREEAPAEEAATVDVQVDDNKQAEEAAIEDALSHDATTDLPRAEPASEDKADIESAEKDWSALDVRIDEKRMNHIRAEETPVESSPTEVEGHQIDSAPVTIPMPPAAPTKPAIQQTAIQVPRTRPQTPQIQPQTSHVPGQPSPVGQPTQFIARSPQVPAQLAQIAAQPPQAIAQPSQGPQPSTEVLQQLQKLYEESGREMPPMQLQDAPQTQSLPGNGLMTRDLQKRPGAPSDAPRKKPNILQRIFKLRGSKQAAATDAPPADHPRMMQAQTPSAQPQRVVIPAAPANPPAPQPATVAPGLAASPKSAAAPAAPAHQSAPEQPAESPAPVAEPQRIVMSVSPALEHTSVPEPSPRPAASAAHATSTPAATVASVPANNVPVQSAAIGSDVAIEEAAADDEPVANDDFNPFTGLKLTDAESTQAAKPTEMKTAEAPAITPTTAAPSRGLVFPEISFSNEPGRVRARSTGEIERVHTELVANSEPGRVHARSAADTFTPASDTVGAPSRHADQIRRIIERSGKPGIKGFCLVALRDDRELVDAQPEFHVSHDGKEYYFSSAKSKAKFAENPVKYLPAAGGADVVVLTHTNQAVPGTLEYSLWFRERLFMFSSNESRQTFIRNPQQYLAAAASGAE